MTDISEVLLVVTLSGLLSQLDHLFSWSGLLDSWDTQFCSQEVLAMAATSFSLLLTTETALFLDRTSD